nr:hypothetical protein [uncultured Roseateles sp.]
MSVVNEHTTCYVSVSFRDRGGLPAVPASVTYRIDCATNGQQIKAWTAVDAAAEVSITIAATENAIIDDANAEEERHVTVIASYGVGAEDQVTAEHVYRVRNLRFVS